jgi:hypothetical protein
VDIELARKREREKEEVFRLSVVRERRDLQVVGYNTSSRQTDNRVLGSNLLTKLLPAVSHFSSNSNGAGDFKRRRRSNFLLLRPLIKLTCSLKWVGDRKTLAKQTFKVDMDARACILSLIIMYHTFVLT